MIGARGAAVTIQVAPSVDGYRLTCTSPRQGVQPFEHTLAASAIGEARKALDEGLTALKTALPDLDGDGDKRCLQDLASILGQTGRTIILLLFGSWAPKIRALQIFWQEALPAWQNPAYVPVIECLGDEQQLLPLEFLPLLDMYGCDREIADADVFVRRLRAFVGFSCVVRRRVLKVPVRDGSPLLAAGRDGKLRMRYLRHDGLAGAEAEFDWLRSEAAAMASVVGPLPGGPIGADDFAHELFDPRWSPAGDLDCLTAIEHFACHCYTSTRASPLQYELQLRGGGHELLLTLRDLGQRLVALGAQADRPDREMPLVVLNACGGSKVDATTSIGFPKLFLENGNRGFLGSEIAVPDGFAAAFSAEFYRALLLQGYPFGESVHRARTKLLIEHLNPLGVVYVAYGNTDLRTTTAKGRLT